MAIRPEIGQTIITKTNQFSGTVQEVRENKNGTFAVRLTLDNGNAHWTTVR